jgi:signal transduction histidine kinase
VSGLDRLGLRARTTVLVTGFVGVCLAVTAVLLVTLLGRSLERGVDDSGRQRAREVAVLVENGSLPEPVPLGAGTAVVQVVDRTGSVTATSVGGDALVPLAAGRDLAYLRSGGALPLPGSRVGVPDRLRLVGTPAGDGTVLVAVATTQARATVRLVSLALVVLFPLLLIAFAAVCWRVVGAALRPVEQLRRGAEEVSGGAALGRLPVPAGADEVHRLALTLNGMLERLERSAVRQRAFVADAAHELRSPLASVRTQVEVARAHPEVGSWEETADGVLEDIDRMARLVDDLLLLARMDAGQQRTARRASEAVDVGAVVAAAVAVAAGARVQVRSAVSGELRVAADPDGLRRVVQNLVDNAVRHARTEVSVEATREEGDVVLAVADDGPGVPDADRERVFERFARLDDARGRDSGGSGLGLAIVRELVTAYAGTVGFVDASRVVVRLPALPAAVLPAPALREARSG